MTISLSSLPVCHGGQREATLVQGQADRASVPIDNILQGSPRVLSASCHVLQRDWLTVRTFAMASNTASCLSFRGVSLQFIVITSAMVNGIDS